SVQLVCYLLHRLMVRSWVVCVCVLVGPKAAGDCLQEIFHPVEASLQKLLAAVRFCNHIDLCAVGFEDLKVLSSDLWVDDTGEIQTIVSAHLSQTDAHVTGA